MTRPTIDQRPGALPEIRTDRSDIIYTIAPTGTHRHADLVLRCDANGDVWASLARTIHSEPAR
jgi:hypothetical protein